jgi:crossover junction endodeoxyribonuclease RusA
VPSVTLPYPPSVNTYWRSLVIGGAARVVISERGRLYREAVQRAAREQWTPDMHQPIGTRLFVSIEVYPPNRRAFDIDNLCKSLLDAMTHAGFWVDDGQIDSLWVRRMTPIRGMVRVHFRAMTDGEVKACNPI